MRFLENPKIPLDTNGVERVLRGVAVGRKNHYGSRSERGTRVAALFCSLIESAKMCGVEPRAYLREATLRAVRNPGHGDPAPRSQVAVHSVPSPLLRHCHPSTASARRVRSRTMGSWERRAIKIVR